jgi:hypothetical protein
MADTAMVAPAFAMVGLTYAVWIRLYVTRIGEMKRRRIHPQSIALSGQAASRLEDTRAADNFRNLFELPVLLYVAVVVAILGGVVTPVSLGLAWAFVLLRMVHSAIHCTYNKVMHRFASYLAGGVVLALLWAYLAVSITW